MFITQSHRHLVQRTVCLILAAIIVSSGLTVGALAAQSLERDAMAVAQIARA